MDDLQKSTCSAALGGAYAASQCPQWMLKFVADAEETFQKFRMNRVISPDRMPLVFMLGVLSKRVDDLERQLKAYADEPADNEVEPGPQKRGPGRPRKVVDPIGV